MSENTTGAWVVDPAASTATFASKTFWGLATVRGTFGGVSGSGTVAEDGTISGELILDASKLDTKNKKRDEHLRSKDFFDTEQHPSVVLRLSSAKQTGDTIEGTGTIEAAGKTQPLTFTAKADDGDDSVTLTAEATVDHRALGMTWNQFGMLAGVAKGTVTARFVRA
ncbi:MAG TPA: YceI family protein [Trebonia sp.]|jgi:polyisoprenoid-binding protein YceI|nr:YceI family protein [Trebonia sp.]